MIDVFHVDFGVLAFNGPDGHRMEVPHELYRLVEWVANHQEEVQRLRDSEESKKLSVSRQNTR